MRILVIGGSGFIGTSLVPLLIEAGHSVRIYDLVTSRSHPELCTLGDVRSYEGLCTAMENADAVINLAAEHADNVEPPSRYYDVNVDGAKCVVRAATTNGLPRIIYTSTAALYGLDRGEVCESMVPQPFNDYGRSKLLAEQVYSTWAEEAAERCLVILRPTVIFGCGNRGNVYNLFRQINSGAFAMIGSGHNQKSLGYVKNITVFISHVLNLQPGTHLFNYSDKPDLSMNDLVGTVRNALGKHGRQLQLPFWCGLLAGYCCDMINAIKPDTVPISSIRIRKFCEHTILNCERLQQTGFTPPFSLVEAVENTVRAEFGVCPETPVAKCERGIANR